MSPIFVRPVREQLEHDRLIRYLIPKYKRRFEVGVNVGDEQVAPVRLGTSTYYPDLVLSAGKKLAGVVEVETGESVNNLEAMAQWVPFSRSRVPFHLYIPVHTYDVARRFCESHQASVTEVWTYRPAADGFDLVRMFQDASAPTRTSAKKSPAATLGVAPKPVLPTPAAPPPPKPEAKPAAKATAKPAVKTPVKIAAKAKPAAKTTAKPSKAAKPVKAAPKKPAKNAKTSSGRKR